MSIILRADGLLGKIAGTAYREQVSHATKNRSSWLLGVQVSLTGHMVFSTLHINSAPKSIPRLLDMGMGPSNFADALLGTLEQRLAETLCDCKESYVPGAQELKDFI